MKPYAPQPIPLTCLDYARLIRKVGPANAALARYDGLLQSVISPDVMLSPLTNREAVLSSRIEGTQATVDEVLEYEAGMEFEGTKVQEIQEIVNYRKALSLATEALADRPLTLSLIRNMHRVLMDSVRGADKSPGHFRVEQNWLGPEGCAIDQATFVPPSPLQLLDHLEAFERYLSERRFGCAGSGGRGARAVRAAAPVQGWQRTNRPFADPAVPLPETHACDTDVLSQRIPGIAPRTLLRTLARHQPGRRLDRLGGVFPGCHHWAGQGQYGQVREILELYERMKGRITELTRSKHSLRVLDSLFDRPIFLSSDFLKRSGISRPSGLEFLRKLRDAGILHVIQEARGSRSALFAFRELLNIAEGRTVF